MTHKDAHQNHSMINRKNPICAQRKIIPSVKVDNTSERVKPPTPTPPPPPPHPPPPRFSEENELARWRRWKGTFQRERKWAKERVKQPLVLGTESFPGVYGVWGGFFDGSVVKNLPPTQETQEMQVQSLGWEDPLEKEMSAHSNILAWEIPWREEPGGPQSMGLQRVGHGWASEQALPWSGQGRA